MKPGKRSITEELMQYYKVQPDEPGYIEYIECLRKKARTHDEAVKAAAELNISLYKCTFCESWHLTSRRTTRNTHGK